MKHFALLLLIVAVGPSVDAMPVSKNKCGVIFTSASQKQIEAFNEANEIVRAFRGKSSFAFTIEASSAVVRGGLASRRSKSSLSDFTTEAMRLADPDHKLFPEIRLAVTAGALAGNRSPRQVAAFLAKFRSGLDSRYTVAYRAAVIEGALSGKRTAEEALKIMNEAYSLLPYGATPELQRAIIGGVLAGNRNIKEATNFLQEILRLVPNNLIRDYYLAYVRGALAGNRTPEEAIHLARQIRIEASYVERYGAAVFQGTLAHPN